MSEIIEPGRGGSRALAAGLGGAALLAAATLGGSKQARAVTPALTFNDIPGTGDIKVLNYALALEALEADLYVQALQRLTSGGTNALGRTIPGLGIGSGEPDVAYLTEFGKVEREHRDFLNGALGNASILNGALRTAKFDFGIESLDRKGVVDLVYLAERTGVGAYLGAIKFFATKTYLAVAGGIQATEARHTAVVAAVLNRLFNEGLTTAPLASENNGIDTATPPDAVLAAVSPFIVLSA